MADKIDCKQCGGSMTKTKKANRNMALQLLGVVVFIAGLLMLFAFPIGTVVGGILILASLGMGYSQQKVWKCTKCGYFFDRA